MAKEKLNRKRYEQIRRMDHKQMEEYFDGVFLQGYERGKLEAAGSFDADLALESINLIKGVGKTKIQEIKLAMLAAGARFKEEER